MYCIDTYNVPFASSQLLLLNSFYRPQKRFDNGSWTLLHNYVLARPFHPRTLGPRPRGIEVVPAEPLFQKGQKKEKTWYPYIIHIRYNTIYIVVSSMLYIPMWCYSTDKCQVTQVVRPIRAVFFYH